MSSAKSTYMLRAYASTKNGISYGELLTFKTGGAPQEVKKNHNTNGRKTILSENKTRDYKVEAEVLANGFKLIITKTKKDDITFGRRYEATVYKLEEERSEKINTFGFNLKNAMKEKEFYHNATPGSTYKICIEMYEGGTPILSQHPINYSCSQPFTTPTK